MYSGWHVHTAWLFDTLHILLGPHGEGAHGFLYSIGISIKKVTYQNLSIIQISVNHYL